MKFYVQNFMHIIFVAYYQVSVCILIFLKKMHELLKMVNAQSISLLPVYKSSSASENSIHIPSTNLTVIFFKPIVHILFDV